MADEEMANLLMFFRKGASLTGNMESSKKKSLREHWENLKEMYRKSQADEEEDLDLDEAARKLPPPPILKMMCCEAGVVNDLQELFPKSSERLKWMAVQRREKLEHLCALKD